MDVQVLEVTPARVLLSLGASSDIDRRDNVMFTSARELCCTFLHKRKEKDNAEYGVYRGFDENCLRIKWFMKKALGENVGVGGRTEEEYVKKRRWGCTCGECAEGWFSERMGVWMYGKPYCFFYTARKSILVLVRFAR